MIWKDEVLILLCCYSLNISFFYYQDFKHFEYQIKEERQISRQVWEESNNDTFSERYAHLATRKETLDYLISDSVRDKFLNRREIQRLIDHLHGTALLADNMKKQYESSEYFFKRQGWTEDLLQNVSPNFKLLDALEKAQTGNTQPVVAYFKEEGITLRGVESIKPESER